MSPPPAELEISRLFNAPRPLLWEVWTDPGHLRQWWGPFGPDGTNCAIDFRVGGRFVLTMTAPDGAAYRATGEFINIVKPELIVYEGAPDAATACGCGLPPRARVSVLFVEDGRRTRLTIHTLFPDGAARDAANAAGFSTSWGMALNALANFFDGGAFAPEKETI